jgi:hypothetical protein
LILLLSDHERLPLKRFGNWSSGPVPAFYTSARLFRIPKSKDAGPGAASQGCIPTRVDTAQFDAARPASIPFIAIRGMYELYPFSE